MRGQNNFRVYFPDFKIRALGKGLLRRLGHMENVYPEVGDATAYSQSKQAVKSAADYIETAYRDDGLSMQLTQCCVFIWHLVDWRCRVHLTVALVDFAV